MNSEAQILTSEKCLTFQELKAYNGVHYIKHQINLNNFNSPSKISYESQGTPPSKINI